MNCSRRENLAKCVGNLYWIDEPLRTICSFHVIYEDDAVAGVKEVKAMDEYAEGKLVINRPSAIRYIDGI